MFKSVNRAPSTRFVARITLAAAVAASLVLAGCAAPGPSGAVYTAGEAQREQVVRMATVESVRPVTIQGQENGVGTAAGAIVGGVAGSNVGGHNGSIVGGILGAVAGGVVGQAVERSTEKKPGVEITVRMDNGDLRAIVQEGAEEVFHPGERVRLVSRGGTTRVTH